MNKPLPPTPFSTSERWLIVLVRHRILYNQGRIYLQV